MHGAFSTAWAPGITSRGSPTLVTFATITLLKPRLWSSACEVLLGGLDEEAAVKSAIWLSKGCACLLSSTAVISETSLSGSSTSALASSSGRSRTIDRAFLHHLF